jgi:hypothetical protein
VREIVSIDLDQRLIDADSIANALEPSPDRQFLRRLQSSELLLLFPLLCSLFHLQPEPRLAAILRRIQSGD